MYSLRALLAHVRAIEIIAHQGSEQLVETPASNFFALSTSLNIIAYANIAPLACTAYKRDAGFCSPVAPAALLVALAAAAVVAALAQVQVNESKDPKEHCTDTRSGAFQKENILWGGQFTAFIDNNDD